MKSRKVRKSPFLFFLFRRKDERKDIFLYLWVAQKACLGVFKALIGLPKALGVMIFKADTSTFIEARELKG